MGTGSTPSSPPARSPRPPAWFFVVVAILIVAGIAAPIGVSWYEHRVAATVPVDTTGNSRRDTLRAGTARDSAARESLARDSVRRR